MQKLTDLLGFEDWSGAACAEQTNVGGHLLPKHDPDLWWEEVWINRAKIVCSDCPIRLKCLEYAIRNKETDGVWGGLTAPERRQIRQKVK